MSVVNILNVQVLDNPTRFTNPFQFEITFECTLPLREDLEFKVVYVGSAEDAAHDQVLDCIMVGPVPVGVNKFVFQADGPRPELIPQGDVTGVTVVLITCSYRGQEFVRVGYYVSNELEALPGQVLEGSCEGAPPVPTAMTPDVVARLVRTILADRPRVTRFPIRWDVVDELEAPAEAVSAPAPGQLLTEGDNDYVSSSLPSENSEEEDDDEMDAEGEIDLEAESDFDEESDEAEENMDTADEQHESNTMVTDSPEHATIAPSHSKTHVFPTDTFPTHTL